MLGLPHLLSEYTVDTDAYQKQIGCVLLQMQPDGTNRLIRYWSHSLNDAKSAHDTTICQCLAVIWAVVLLRTYLEGCWLTVCTDRDALKWTFKFTGSTDKLACWWLRLSGFECDVVHCKGLKHQAADALWRLKSNGTDQALIKDDILVLSQSVIYSWTTGRDL